MRIEDSSDYDFQVIITNPNEDGGFLMRGICRQCNKELSLADENLEGNYTGEDPTWVWFEVDSGYIEPHRCKKIWSDLK
jgi:hypothetical protein